MLSEDVLARLGQLIRSPAPGVPHEVAGERSAGERAEISSPDEEPVDQLPSGQEVENAWGKHWIRQRDLALVWPPAEEWLERASARALEPLDTDYPTARELRALLDALPDRAIYLDLETCGFAGSMIFLIGVIHPVNGRLVLSQLFARDYAEEKPMLQSFWSIAARNDVLATFNGKSFDWPMVHDRSTVHHLGEDTRGAEGAGDPPRPVSDPDAPLSRRDARPDLAHCDLLHHARRRWKHQLPNCKLATLERFIFGRQRTGDIAGREIPAAYHDFVRHGDAWLIRSVLHHNALDLITLLQLSVAARPASLGTRDVRERRRSG